MDWVTERRVVVRPDAQGVADLVARKLLSRLISRTEAGKVTHVALTGGTLGVATLRAVNASGRRDDVDWSAVHAWWSDERFVPREDPERNARQAREALLDHVALPTGNIHEIAPSDAGLAIDDAATAYEAELARFASEGAEGPWPNFDVCLLGVGRDGHIASLFPDRPEILITDRTAVPVHDSLQPPAERISLTRPVINSAARVWLSLAGADKAAALGLALAGANYASVPAGGAKGRKRTVLFVDDDAAAGTPADLIDRD